MGEHFKKSGDPELLDSIFDRIDDGSRNPVAKRLIEHLSDEQLKKLAGDKDEWVRIEKLPPGKLKKREREDGCGAARARSDCVCAQA